MKLDFKSTYSDGLHTYVFVSGHERHAADANDEEIARMENSDMTYPPSLLGTKISQHLSLASFLLARKTKYVMLRDSPDLHKHKDVLNPLRVMWNYEMIADDFKGSGTDNGFVPSRFPYLVYHTDSLEHVAKLPEEILEEEFSNVTIFGLNGDSTDRLATFFGSHEAPALADFLKPEEIFINLTCGKQYGYFNSFLSKSKSRLDEEFSAFENTTEAGN